MIRAVALIVVALSLAPSVTARGDAAVDIMQLIRRDWHCNAFTCTFPGLSQVEPVDRRFEK